MKNIKLIIIAAVFFVISTACLLPSDKDFSQSERRPLAQKPEISMENLLSGQFESDLEKYAADHFPLREGFRNLKALAEYGIFLKKDNNGIYMSEEHAAKILYPYSAKSVTNATDIFRSIYEEYIKGSKTDKEKRIYVSVIPDKGYYLADKEGVPAMDYDAMFAQVAAEMDYAWYIDLTGALREDCYYRTDLHWRQEKLLPAAEALRHAMGLGLAADLGGLGEPGGLKAVTASDNFTGVYKGQSGLALKGEPLVYLTDEMIEGCITYNYETNAEGKVYDLEKLTGKDPYDVFLSGATALITVENPEAAKKTDRELVIFRDSFGSSMAPLLLSDYARITLVDLRYINWPYLRQFVEFDRDRQDVLFLYGTTLLNDSYTLKR